MIRFEQVTASNFEAVQTDKEVETWKIRKKYWMSM